MGMHLEGSLHCLNTASYYSGIGNKEGMGYLKILLAFLWRLSKQLKIPLFHMV